MAEEITVAERQGYRIGFGVVAFVVLTIVMLVPIGIIDLVRSIGTSGDDTSYALTANVPSAPTYSRLQIDVIALDEVQRLATLRVSGFHFCDKECTDRDKVLFSSIGADGTQGQGVSPSASIILPAAGEFNETFSLPIRSNLLRYPFDRSDLTLGVQLQRISADNRTAAVPAADARNQLFVSIHEQMPRVRMSAPASLNPQPAQASTDHISVSALAFTRPLYLRIAVLFLVVLIAIAAVYAAILRPVGQLIINAGALVFGIFGVRSLLIGNYPPDTTLVDLALAAVAFFLLGTIAVRGMNELHRKGGLHVPGFATERGPAARTRQCPQCLSDIPLAATRCAHCTAPVPPLGSGPPPPVTVLPVTTMHTTRGRAIAPPGLPRAYPVTSDARSVVTPPPQGYGYLPPKE